MYRTEAPPPTFVMKVGNLLAYHLVHEYVIECENELPASCVRLLMAGGLEAGISRVQ